MKITEIVHQPKVKLEIGVPDIELLEAAARRHYDGVCKAQVEQGGLIFELKNRISDFGTRGVVQKTFTFREVDLLAKIAEQFDSEPASKAIQDTLHEAMQQLNADAEKGECVVDAKNIVETASRRGEPIDFGEL